jgi:hypothetical protein
MYHWAMTWTGGVEMSKIYLTPNTCPILGEPIIFISIGKTTFIYNQVHANCTPKYNNYLPCTICMPHKAVARLFYKNLNPLMDDGTTV